MSGTELGATVSVLCLLVLTDWMTRGQGIDRFMSNAPTAFSWAYSWVLLSAFLLMPPSDTGAFIYFQF
jgi:hypothetical protein